MILIHSSASTATGWWWAQCVKCQCWASSPEASSRALLASALNSYEKTPRARGPDWHIYPPGKKRAHVNRA